MSILLDTGLLTIYISSMEATITTANTHFSHCGDNGGSAIVTCTGGFGEYSYLWNDPAGTTNDTVINLAGGSYSVTVSDTLGCVATATVEIENICLGI